jgi:hypothetical protein
MQVSFFAKCDAGILLHKIDRIQSFSYKLVECYTAEPNINVKVDQKTIKIQVNVIGLSFKTACDVTTVELGLLSDPGARMIRRREPGLLPAFSAG